MALRRNCGRLESREAAKGVTTPTYTLEVHTSTKLPKGIDRPSYQVIVTPTSSIDNCRQLLEEFSNLIGRTGLLAHCSLFNLAPTGPETHLFPTIPDFLIDLYPLPKQKNMVNIAGRSRGCSTSRRRRVKCDKKRPICNRCERLGFECSGPKGVAFIDHRKSLKSLRSGKG